ncbi:MAG: hypothetical protein Q7S14_01545 [bacterium]|nr:hypothetical protein [bacterium]
MSYIYRNTIEDVKNTIKLGIKRRVPQSKIDNHYGNFNSLKKLLVSFNIDTGYLDVETTHDIFQMESQKVLDNLTVNMLNNLGNNVAYDKVFDYLSEEDSLEKSDWVFVFGSRNLDRPKKAAELINRGIAQMIYCSGSRPIEEMERKHEGRSFKKYILDNFKIPEENIIADPHENSLTMTDNVRGFLNYLDEVGKLPKSVTIVITTHNLRRGWAIFNKYVTGIKILRCSSGSRTGVERDNWYKSELGIKLIYEEYEKIRIQQLTNTT